MLHRAIQDTQGQGTTVNRVTLFFGYAPVENNHVKIWKDSISPNPAPVPVLPKLVTENILSPFLFQMYTSLQVKIFPMNVSISLT
jgi:hypothetical protein